MKTLILPIALAVTFSACAKHKEAAVLAPVVTVPVVTETVVVDERTPEQQEQEAVMQENFSRVYFAFDEATLNADSKDALTANVAIMRDNPEVTVEIQGHADEVGTNTYNLELGDRRAQAIHDYMVAQGIQPSRLKTVSYGERQLVSDGDGPAQADRRAEFRVLFGSPRVAGTVTPR